MEWKVILDFPKYEVSEFGNIRNFKTKKELKVSELHGYKRVGLMKDKCQINVFIHRVVYNTFVDNSFPIKDTSNFSDVFLTIDHKDSDRR